jgi:hypothetical protein
MNTPLVCMSANAYAAACAEFERWAETGRRRAGMAWEAVVYPLIGLVARPGRQRSPLEPTPLADCAALVVAGVVMPPPALAHYGPTWARPVAGAATAGAAADLQARLAAVRARHPRLDCYGRMHSHPWPHTHPQPSGTDCREHLTGALESNAAAGLPWSLGLIAAAPAAQGLGVGDQGSGIRDQAAGIRGQRVVLSDQPPPPNPQPLPHSSSWPVQAYALLPEGQLVALGAVRVVPDDDARVRGVRAGAGWATPPGQRWLARQEAALAAHGVAVQALPLHRGWYGLALRWPGAPMRLLALPPTFPVAPPRLLRPAPAGGWQGAALPSRGKHWEAYHLPDLWTMDDVCNVKREA